MSPSCPLLSSPAQVAGQPGADKAGALNSASQGLLANKGAPSCWELDACRC